MALHLLEAIAPQDPTGPGGPGRSGGGGGGSGGDAARSRKRTHSDCDSLPNNSNRHTERSKNAKKYFIVPIFMMLYYKKYSFFKIIKHCLCFYLENVTVTFYD
jgi:hypothetical protein